MHHKERLTYVFIFFVLVLIVVAVWVLVVPRTKTTQIFLGNTTYSMTVVGSDEARDEVLAQEDILSGNKGVMVAYSEAEVNQITPKNLHEKSDVVWLSDEKKIIYLARGLPALELDKTYGPVLPSQYVLIFRAGVVTQQKTKIGQKVDFDLKSLW